MPDSEQKPNSQNHVLLLDGSENYVEIAHNEGLNSISTQVTMEAWVKVRSFPKQAVYVLAKRDEMIPGHGNRSYGLAIAEPGHLWLECAAEGEDLQGLYTGYYRPGPIRSVVPLDTWTHISGIIDRRQQVMKLVVNGVCVLHKSFGGCLHRSRNPLRIGWTITPDSSDAPFDGAIDEVRIWSIARDEEAIHRDMYRSLSGREPGLVAYWNFEGQHADVVDVSSGGHDGILVGNATRVAMSLPTPDELHRAYLDSLELELEVRRKKPDKLSDVLVITPSRVGTPGIWNPPSIPVSIQIQSKEGECITTLETETERTTEWTVPETVQGELTVVARCTSHKGQEEVDSTCQAHSTYPVTKSVGRWERYDASDGLAGSWVTSIAQDHSGNMWFGLAWSGLSRFDGREFRTFSKRDGLPSNHIWALHVDNSGVLWIGTMCYDTMEGFGVCCYDGETFRTYTTEDGLVDDAVTAIYQARDGDLWFGTLNGISRYDGESFYNYTGEHGLPVVDAHGSPDVGGRTCISSITQDGQGNLWFSHSTMSHGYGAGASRYDGDQFTTFTTDDGLSGNSVHHITTDTEGRLLLGTVGRPSVMVYDEERFAPIDGLGYGRVTYSVCAARNGELWVGRVTGIERGQNGVFEDWSDISGISSFVSAILEDREGSIWFGTATGVTRYEMGVVTVEHAGIAQGIHTPTIRDRRGDVWFPVTGGTGRYDGEHCQVYRREDGFAGNLAFAMIEDSRGHIWVAAYNSGVSRHDGQRFQAYRPDGPLQVFGIEEDDEGMLWFASSSGLFQYDGRVFTQRLGQQELTGVELNGLMKDNHGRLWIPCWGEGARGMWRWGEDELVWLTANDGLPDANCGTPTCDREGNVWIPTSGGGLCRYDGQSFHTFTTQDGLTSNEVHRGIFQDSRGILWFRVAAGVQCYDGVNFQMLTTQDGLLDNRVLGIIEDDEGNLVFSSPNGFTIYTRPEHPVSPSIRVTEAIAGQVYTMPERVTMLSAVPRVTFSYRGISMRTRRMRYSYRMDGHDEDWQATWEEQVSYENLEPGDYTFRVTAIDRDLTYSAPASVDLQVVPDLRDAQIAELESALERRNRELEAELADARDMQMRLMPEHAPDVEGVEIAGRCVTANTVGGDFFDYLPRSSHQVGLVIADVSGKAMRGAMNAVLVDGILSRAVDDANMLVPGELIAKVNDTLAARMESDMNVTMVVGLLDTASMTLTLANAAHHAYPMLVRDGKVTELKARGLPLGMRAGVEYREEVFDLQSGDVLVLMTDGIIEAHDADGRVYGESGRLENLLREFSSDTSADTMVDAVINDAIAYAGGERDDDMTVITTRVN